MKAPNTTKLAILSVVIAFGVAGCSSDKTSAQSSALPQSAAARGRAVAIARLNPAAGSAARGEVFFSKESEGIRVVGEIIGLTPGTHGLHIHENGDCSPSDSSSAGGHFNPTGAPHGGPTEGRRHLGDLGNITANKSGIARIGYTTSRITLEEVKSFIGHSLVVDAQADDFKSQPAGNAGARVACGVVERK